MKKSFMVVGLGRFGLNIAKTLGELKSDVIAIDINKDAVAEAASYIEHCVICDSTSKKALKEVGGKNVDHAVVAIGNNLQASLLTVINLSELGIKKITVRVDTDDYKLVMMRMGATEVLIPEEVSAISLANQIVSDSFLEYYRVDKEYSMIKIIVNKDFKEKSLIDIDSPNKFSVNIIGIIRNEKFIQPTASDVIAPEDVLLVFGKTSKIGRFERFINN